MSTSKLPTIQPVSVIGSKQYHLAPRGDSFTLCGRILVGTIDLRIAMHRTKPLCPRCNQERRYLSE